MLRTADVNMLAVKKRRAGISEQLMIIIKRQCRTNFNPYPMDALFSESFEAFLIAVNLPFTSIYGTF